jgi:DNA-binding HxlR family transcriptional regulator
MTVECSGARATGEGNEQLTGSAVEDVAFLARSEHRLHLLGLLAGGPCSREELRERMDATRVTLSRILGDLEDRGLIRRRNSEGGYELSTFGELVYRDFARLLGTVSVGQTYPDLISRLPTDRFDSDLRHLVDGEEQFTVEGLQIREDAPEYRHEKLDHPGDLAYAKDLKRVYARDESLAAWSAW